MMVMNTPRMRVIPWIGLDFRLNGLDRTARLFAPDADRHDSTFSGGVGLVLWNRLTVVPTVVVVFGSAHHSGLQMTVGYTLLRR
jgi:hypothetical protein